MKMKRSLLLILVFVVSVPFVLSDYVIRNDTIVLYFPMCESSGQLIDYKETYDTTSSSGTITYGQSDPFSGSCGIYMNTGYFVIGDTFGAAIAQALIEEHREKDFTWGVMLKEPSDQSDKMFFMYTDDGAWTDYAALFNNGNKISVMNNPAGTPPNYGIYSNHDMTEAWHRVLYIFNYTGEHISLLVDGVLVASYNAAFSGGSVQGYDDYKWGINYYPDVGNSGSMYYSDLFILNTTINNTIIQDLTTKKLSEVIKAEAGAAPPAGEDNNITALNLSLYLNGTQQNINIFDSDSFYAYYYVNSSSVQVNLTINGTEIANNSLQSLSPGYYNFTARIDQNTSVHFNNVSYFANVVSGPALQLHIMSATGSYNVTQNEFFQIQVNVTCIQQDCQEVNISLDPFPLFDNIFQFFNLNFNQDSETTEIKPKPTAECTLNTKTVNYGNGTYSLTVGEIYANSQCQKRNEVPSLKTCEFCDNLMLRIGRFETYTICEEVNKNLKCYNASRFIPLVDPRYPITQDDIIDYNSSSITFKPKISKSELNKDIPIQSYHFNLSYDKINQEIQIEKEINVITNINLENVNQAEIMTLPFGFDTVIKVGNYSTEIILQDADTENLDDDTAFDNYDSVNIYVGDTDALTTLYSYIKFDIQQIPAGSTIDSATLKFNCVTDNADADDYVGIYETHGAWKEEDEPTTAEVPFGDQITQVINPNTGWNEYTVTTWVSTQYGNGYDNVSFGVKLVEDADSDLDYVEYRSKEHTTSSERPILDIYYTGSGGGDNNITALNLSLYLNGTQQDIEAYYQEDFYVYYYVNSTRVMINMTRNGTEILNNSLQDLVPGYYNFTIRIDQNDSVHFNNVTYFANVNEAIIKHGLISNQEGTTPFYTNITNPYNVTLAKDESIILTFYVNATGALNSTHEFFVDVNNTADFSFGNSSVRWNVTIIEKVTTADTCSCPSSGDWYINAADNCVITSDCNLQGNNGACAGEGTLTVKNAKIYNFNLFKIHSSCLYYCYGGQCMAP